MPARCALSDSEVGSLVDVCGWHGFGLLLPLLRVLLLRVLLLRVLLLRVLLLRVLLLRVLLLRVLLLREPTEWLCCSAVLLVMRTSCGHATLSVVSQTSHRAQRTS